MTYRLRVYVGPTLVGSLAAEFRAAGLQVTTEGTAHVYCAVEADTAENARYAFLTTLRTQLGKTFCLTAQDVQAYAPLQ